MQSVLYRVLQESLHNIVKHAAAGEVLVKLCLADNGGELVIRDNGRGLEPNQPAAGCFGLTGMKERVKESGGEFAIRSEPGKGTTVAVRF